MLLSQVNFLISMTSTCSGTSNSRDRKRSLINAEPLPSRGYEDRLSQALEVLTDDSEAPAHIRQCNSPRSIDCVNYDSECISRLFVFLAIPGGPISIYMMGRRSERRPRTLKVALPSSNFRNTVSAPLKKKDGFSAERLSAPLSQYPSGATSNQGHIPSPIPNRYLRCFSCYA